MRATVNQSPVWIAEPFETQEGVPIETGTVTARVFNSAGNVLAATAMAHVSNGWWAYSWEPATLPAGQYFIDFQITYDGSTYSAGGDLEVTDNATPANVTAAQGAVQTDIADSQTAVQSDVADVQAAVDAVTTDVADSQTAIQADIAEVSTDVDTANAGIIENRQAVLADDRIIDDQLIKYAADGVTPIKTYNLTDADGDPTSTNPVRKVSVG